MSEYFKDDPRTQQERMLAGDLYIADDPVLARASREAIRMAAEYSRIWAAHPDTAARILRRLLGSIGEGTEIRAPLYVDYGKNITVGARTFINYNLTALDVVGITIGDDVQIGPNVQLLTPTHPLDAQQRRDKLEAGKPIVIEDNVWLGGGVIVLPGVTIGENTVVGAGAIVTKDLPPNVVATGRPAKIRRGLLDPTSLPPQR
ncbi:sugar O-acetyltransferase [Arthrobacter sp. I2-34]|uniref:Sugar O-acetyltransferase n=1 Tax=Arthrobacter hankyongi TaxID=2904801 RepID=A0ABS9L3E0_9MICC|nr:sugar O-acetyltransferase [Arthrobacter hankyongi]MCG2621161.1 sugar O-acetyltransferase [Arthrobacter hankyongi]